MALFSDDPIIACSSSLASSAAIAVVRISGFADLSELVPFLSCPVEKIIPRKVFYTMIVDKLGKYSSKGEEVDSALGTFFKAPHSYNGENILELSIHGNRINVQRVLQLFCSEGKIRPAVAGEFTYRALKNRKLTLSQVEGLDLLLNATSSYVLEQGQGILQGEVNRSYLELEKRFKELRVSIEINIDFVEDVGEEKGLEIFKNNFLAFTLAMKSLYQRALAPINYLHSPDVVFVGPTNAGKSTLFNRLLRMNRSIVSPVAGTTRDYVSESLFVEGGQHFRLIDTAGIRATHLTGEIEQEGIKRSLDVVANAFFKVLVLNPFDIANGGDSGKDFAGITFDLLVLTHNDKENFTKKTSEQSFKEYLSKIKFHELLLCGPIGPAMGGTAVSVGPIGPEFSEEFLKLLLAKYALITKESPIILERHRQLIRKIHKHTLELQKLCVIGVESVDEFIDFAVAATIVDLIGQDISELIGVVSPDHVLKSIFDNFCIGK
ncbi:MAG: 50S ribosome-binding GTPase [Oligoflexia bacterium]|nr:50S ribosome-binding GTPase [Oligoflexia bacterium]